MCRLILLYHLTKPLARHFNQTLVVAADHNFCVNNRWYFLPELHRIKQGRLPRSHTTPQRLQTMSFVLVGSTERRLAAQTTYAQLMFELSWLAKLWARKIAKVFRKCSEKMEDSLPSAAGSNMHRLFLWYNEYEMSIVLKINNAG